MKAWILKRIKIIKNKFNNLIINTKELYKSDPIVFYYVFGAVFNAILLRFMSVKNYFGISPILADLFISCLFISLYLTSSNSTVDPKISPQIAPNKVIPPCKMHRF